MDNIINEMENYAKKENVPIMQKRGINFLCKLIKNNNVKNILEIGTAIGYSAIRMSNVSEDILVTSIERDEVRYLEAVKNVKKAKKEKQITLILGDALDIEIDEMYDLIFIDAAKGQYIKFFNKFSKNLRKGGIIVSDNLAFHGLVEEKERINNKNLRQLVNKIKKYIIFLKDNTEYETKFYKTGDGIGVSVKKED